MFKNLALALVFIGISLSSAYSQDCAFLAIESQEILPNESFCVELSLVSPESLSALQWTLAWDPEIITFDTIINLHPILANGSFVVNDIDYLNEGALPTTWVYNLIDPLPAFTSNQLMSVCFSALDTISANAIIDIADFIVTPELVSTNLETIPFCSSIGNINVTNTPNGTQNPIVHGYTTDKNCELGQEGSIEIFPFFGTEPYSFVWGSNNGYNSTSQNISGLSGGIYNLTIVDDTGNTAVESFEIFEIGAPTLPIPNFTRPLCADDNTGIIDISPSFGTAPYTFEWSNNTFQEDLVNVPPGTYEVTVTDSNGCQAIKSWILNYSNYHILSIAAGGSICPSTPGGFIDLTPNPDAAMPLTYLWSNGSTTEDLIDIPNGIYQLSVTDADGCLNTYEFDVTGATAPTVASKVLTCPSNGNANGSATVTLSYSLPDFIFNWEDGSTSSTGERNSLSDGNYAFTVTDDSGCELLTDSFRLETTIEYFDNHYFSCGLDSIELLFTSTSAADAFSWSPAQYFDQPLNEDAILLSPNFDFSGGIPTPIALSFSTTAVSGCQTNLDFQLTAQENCVWPGDVNEDNVVTLNDMLNIALSNGATGTPRAFPTSEWAAQPVDLWGTTIAGSSIDESSADCDGNGQVEALDTNTVLQNLGLSHFSFGGSDASSRAMHIPLSVVLPDEFRATEQSEFEIHLGDASLPLEDAYGLVFQLAFDHELVEGEKGSVSSDGWISTGNTPWVINIDDSAPGILDVVLTRNDGTGVDGFGKIASLFLPFKSFLDNEEISIAIRNATMINANGELIALEEMTSNSTLIGTSVSTSNLDLVQTEFIFPNPSKGIINIQSERNIEQISIQNINGKNLDVPSTNGTFINIKDYPAGTYILQLIGPKGTTIHRFIKVD